MKNIIIVTTARSGSTYFSKIKAQQYKLNFFKDEMELFSAYNFAPNRIDYHIEQIEKYNKHGHFYIVKIHASD